MKKVILSLVMVATALAGKAQVTGFTYDFSTTCLNNLTYSGSVWQNGDGAVNTGVSRNTTDNALEITSVATDQRTAGYSVQPIVFDIYDTYGSGPSATCSPLRGQGDVIDMSAAANGKVKIVAKASAAMTLRLELGYYAPGGANVKATNENGNVNAMALTTSYAEYTFDYNGVWGTFPSSTIDVVRFKFNVGDPGASTTGFDGTVSIKSIKFGSDATTGTTEASVDNSLISVYPNPAKDQINVDLSSMNASSATVKVMNANGMVVYEGKASNSGNEVINTSSFNKGIYLVQVSAGSKVSNKKIVIE